jgi:hypothetical protein
MGVLRSYFWGVLWVNFWGILQNNSRCRAVPWWVGVSGDGDPVAGNGDPRLGHGQNKTQPQSAKTKPKLQIKETQQNQQRTFLLPPRRLAAQPRQPAWI